MKLNSDIINNEKELKEKGYQLFHYNRQKVKAETLEEPIWVHFGAGNIFRGFIATLQEKLIEQSMSSKGIIVCEAYDTEIIDKAYKPYDDLSILATLKNDGTVEKQIIGSVVASLKINQEEKESFEQLKTLFKKPSLQMISFTITEKGYKVSSNQPDLIKEPSQSESLMGRIVYLCYERYKAGKLPLALVSMDNCSQNGKKLYEAVMTFTEAWIQKGFIEPEFKDYVQDSEKLAFPWTMIDKITPQPNAIVKEILEQDGFEGQDIVKTTKNTWIAPFVNAEEVQYLVVEDAFPNSRPELEKAGVLFTTREKVGKIERMKVGTCLNPLHTALAIFGCLLGYQRVSEEMKDPHLSILVQKIGYDEGLPVVVNPGIIKPIHFIKEVIEKRLPNPFIPDSPWRIIADTSQKMPIRFGETIKAYVRSEIYEVNSLKYIPLVIAGWCRYLLGIDDTGRYYEVGPDPMATELREKLEGIYIGSEGCIIEEKLQPILSDATLFGENLYEIGMAEKVKAYFKEMIKEKGAVRETLKKYL